jgi:hypothetical protein
MEAVKKGSAATGYRAHFDFKRLNRKFMTRHTISSLLGYYLGIVSRRRGLSLGLLLLLLNLLNDGRELVFRHDDHGLPLANDGDFHVLGPRIYNL